MAAAYRGEQEAPDKALDIPAGDVHVREDTGTAALAAFHERLWRRSRPRSR